MLKLRLSIDPDKALITFDYRDMPDQMPFPHNLTYATARGSALQGTLPILDPTLPHNDGVLDHIEVLLREGAIAGIPHWPVCTSDATTGFSDTVTNLVFKAWAKVVPERALAGMGECGAANMCSAGVDRRTSEPYSHMYYLAGSGAGATENYDGLPHMFSPSVMGNMGYESVEAVELAVPHIIWDTFAITDSGGAGKWRGGIAVGHRIQPREHDMLISFFATGHTCNPFGLFSGLPGSLGDHWLVDHTTGKEVKHLPNLGLVTCKSGEEWVAVTSGGGGFGDPLERDPEAVRDDVRDGFVSLEAARDIYKVVVNTEPELYEVDYTATQKLRAEAKGELENGLPNRC